MGTSEGYILIWIETVSQNRLNTIKSMKFGEIFEKSVLGA